jgi:hypothetical protein
MEVSKIAVIGRATLLVAYACLEVDSDTHN